VPQATQTQILVPQATQTQIPSLPAQYQGASHYYPKPLACSIKGPTQLPGEHTAELQFEISATG
jgi:hypothetical protein